MLSARPFALASAIAALAAAAYAQPAIGPAGRVVNPGIFLDSFQVGFFPSPTGGAAAQGFVDIVNTGALGASATGPGVVPPVGDVCVNVYTFAANQQELQCCSCLVSPNALAHLPSSDFVPGAGRRVAPTAGFVIKLLTTVPGPNFTTPGTNGANGSAAGPFTNTVCNPAIAFDTQNLAPGTRAWATTVQTNPATSTPSLLQTEFQTAILSPGEITKMTNICSVLQANAGGGGTCPSCLNIQ